MISIREIIALVFIVLAVIMFSFSLIGVNRFKYVLNRMHAAGIGDTLGILFLVIGVLILLGLNWQNSKLILIVIFMWITSPIQSHYMARVERMTNEDYKKRIEGRK